MNKKELVALGISGKVADEAILCIRKAHQGGYFHGKTVKKVVRDVITNPTEHITHEYFSSVAQMLATEETEALYTPEMKPYKIWGEMDENTLKQFQNACSLPVAVRAASMPDNHLGYGLNIGGVLATEDAVVPYAVGVDISCMMKISILDEPIKKLNSNQEKFEKAIEDGTNFGMGGSWSPRRNHQVMDQDWNVTHITKQLKDRAWTQLGTSGSGNHFVEFGIVKFDKPDLGLEPGEYIALLSHSGSRGTGANICSFYTGVAKGQLDAKYKKYFNDLAWLDMKGEPGQEYWAAMNLMGNYASGNHACIHENVIDRIGAKCILSIENKHNLAWIEKHDGKDLYVHRKGATPAGKGVLGIIPGSMADPAFIVRGKGNPDSLNSASHGAGRRMSRKQAFVQMDWHKWKGILRQRGVKLISGGLDEVPGCYKDITKIMEQQSDLVETVAEFFPRIVKMSDDGKRED